MDNSRKIAERLWNMPDKGELKSHREQTFIDDIIPKSHIEEELLSHLDGIKTVFDGCAGCGRFSILLAKHGCEVTHKANAIEAFHFSKDDVMKIWEEGLMGGDSEIEEYENGGVPWCITYTFMPDELENILKRYGVKNIKLAGPGAYARTIPNELLVKIMNDSKQRSDFLDFCHYHDSNPFVCGMGKDNLFAWGEL